MFEKFKFWLVVAIAVLLLINIVPLQNVSGYFTYAFSTKTNLNINLTLINPSIKSISADPSNPLVMRAEIRNSEGKAVSNAQVVLSVSNNNGQIYPSSARTDKNGECLVSYIPPPSIPEQLQKEDSKVTITAGIYKTNTTSSLSVQLIKTPLLFIHGYQSTATVFDNMKGYFAQRGYQTGAISYKSQDGVVAASKELNSFIQQQKMQYLSKGIQVKKFDIITHSMGGLVARYYSCGDEYIKNNDIRKIIFISIPHRGSLWASIGVGYYNDQGIRDLIPDSELISVTLPSMLNRGLNPMVQIGSIIGQYDEVVSPESASIDEWNIKTEVFNVGENNFSVNNLLNRNILETANHATILNNRKIFERIEGMLNSNLTYPAIRK